MLNKESSTKILLPIFFIICGFIFVFFLSNTLENSRPPLPENYTDQDLALQGSRLKGYSLGFEGLIADWYWMQALQYVGNKILENPDAQISLDNMNALNPRLLYPLLDNATDLDPRFMAVYSYGAVVLPTIDKEQAITLLEKGISENPNQWHLYHELGYIYWRLENYEKAATLYEQGAHLPGAPKWMVMLALRMKSEGGSRETARAVYRQMLEETQDEQIREHAALRLLQLEWFDERDAIRDTLGKFKEKNNRCAESWSEIFALLKNYKLQDGRDFRIDAGNNLVDPSGAPYRLEQNECNVELDFEKTKVPIN